MKDLSKINFINGLGLPQQIAEHLADDIRDNRLKPGEKLPPEIELCKIFKVSRTAIREAIARLRHEGLLESKRGSGISVAPLEKRQSFGLATSNPDDPEQINFLYEIRIMVGVESAGLAAIRHTDNDLMRLNHFLEELAKTLKEKKDGSIPHRAFHKTIAEASYNPYLIEFEWYIHEKLWKMFRESRHRTQTTPGMDVEVHQEHQLLLDSIKSRVPILAREAAMNHLVNSTKRNNLIVHHKIA